MTGIELIAKEREEQITKHFRTIEEDVEFNRNRQLVYAAADLIHADQIQGCPELRMETPEGWNPDIYEKIINKTYRERLIIAGALIAAEIDRINYVMP